MWFGRKFLAIAVAGSICGPGFSQAESVVEDFFAPSQHLSAAEPVEDCSVDVELVNQESPLAGRIFVRQSNLRFQLSDLLAPLEGIEFTTNRATFPAFSIAAGPVDDAWFGITSRMSLVYDCQTYTAILIRTGNPHLTEVLPTADWAAVAGLDAITAHTQLLEDCERLESVNVMQAVEKFGNPPVRLANGQGISATTFIGCQTAIHALAYGVLVQTSEGDIVISNVAGQLFIEEL